jgi:hypothetical protein
MSIDILKNLNITGVITIGNQSSTDSGIDTPAAAATSSGSLTIIIIVVVVCFVVCCLCAVGVIVFFLRIRAPESERASSVMRQASLQSMKSDIDGVLVVPTQSQRSKAIVPKAMPEGKKYHYFISHKKWHSTMYNEPEQSAMGLHDYLTNQGFKGFFDVDNLKEISKEELMKCCKQSCTMVIYLHDETMQSEWCRLEWEVAQKHGVPLLVVADCEHCDKKTMLGQISPVYPFLMQNQWVDYLGGHRQFALTSMSTWVDSQIEEQLQSPQVIPGAPHTSVH